MKVHMKFLTLLVLSCFALIPFASASHDIIVSQTYEKSAESYFLNDLNNGITWQNEIMDATVLTYMKLNDISSKLDTLNTKIDEQNNLAIIQSQELYISTCSSKEYIAYLTKNSSESVNDWCDQNAWVMQMQANSQNQPTSTVTPNIYGGNP